MAQMEEVGRDMTLRSLLPLALLLALAAPCSTATIGGRR